MTSSTETPMRRSTYRASGWPAEPAAASRSSSTSPSALLGSDGADIDRPDRVVRRARHRRRRDDVGGRLHERDERARGVETLLELLVQGVPLGRVGRRTRLGGHRVDRGRRRGGPVRALADQATGSEGEVVGGIRKVRPPVPKPHLLLAVAVVVELGGDGGG